MTELEKEDRKWMRRAIALARLSEGYTRPNPPVGAVIVKDGRKIGEGRHMAAGLPHAEVNAFEACGESPKGATLYVTLEPCSTTGRTPPCTDRILKEGIARVVVGCVDENSRHAGAGLTLLRERGVAVEVGVCGDEARELALPFFKHIRTGMPFVTLKLGMTLDGRIADRTNHSQWITGEAARGYVQTLRRRADAVCVGSGTALADNPSLLCRIEGGERLLRVVIDAKGKLPPGSQLLTDGAAERTRIMTTPEVADRQGGAWSRHGAQVWRFEPDARGHLDLHEVLYRLGHDEQVMHLLCEGGGGLAGALHEAGLVDEYALFYAPMVLGDDQAISGFAGQGGTLLGEIQRLTLIEVRKLDEDVLVRYRP